LINVDEIPTHCHAVIMTVIDVPRGLAGVAVAETSVGDVRGEEGFYHYRQYDATTLARTQTFEDVWELLIDGALPDLSERAAFVDQIAAGRVLPAPVEPLVTAASALGAPDGELRAVVAAVGAAHHMRPTADLSPTERRADAVTLVAAIPTAAAALHRRRQGLTPVAPDPDRGVVADYLRQLTDTEPRPQQVRALEQYLVSTIDHGFNASTFTARVVASTGADMAACVVAALGALSGPRHGGAPSRVLEMLDAIGAPANAERWVRAELDAGRRIPGFGHPVYRSTDPRSALLAEVAERLGAPRVADGHEVEEIVLAELARRHPERRLITNVEFWASIVLEGSGVPRGLFTSTFAIARAVGWTAHILEQAADSKIIRPAAHYVGPDPSA
jgi:citrate synthase